MFTNGSIVQSASGRSYQISGTRGMGGQATAYDAVETASGQVGVVKLFHAKLDPDLLARRTRFLIDQDLHNGCPAICAPIDLIHNGVGTGHFVPLAPGVCAADLIAGGSQDLVGQLQLAVAVARAIEVLEARGIAYGDVQLDHVLVEQCGSVLKAYLIDLDNFSEADQPPPPCVGHQLYMAPELRKAHREGKPACPNLASDHFALGVLQHEIVFLRHPAAGRDAEMEQFEAAMTCGFWPDDPARQSGAAPPGGGYAASVVHAGMAALFRRAFSLDPDIRPSPAEWVGVLSDAMCRVSLCPACDRPVIVDPAKTCCPYDGCGKPFPVLKLVVDGAPDIVLDKGDIVIGRFEVNGSAAVSVRHARFSHLGPDTYVESWGTNGTWRFDGENWIRLPANRSILLADGDRLRLADTEAIVTAAAPGPRRPKQQQCLQAGGGGGAAPGPECLEPLQGRGPSVWPTQL